MHTTKARNWWMSAWVRPTMQSLIVTALKGPLDTRQDCHKQVAVIVIDVYNCVVRLHDQVLGRAPKRHLAHEMHLLHGGDQQLPSNRRWRG